MTARIEVLGHGHYVPEREVCSATLEAQLSLPPGWIEQRTGITARRYASPDQALSDLAIHAGTHALRTSGVDRSTIASVLLATSTPDHLLPPTAPLVAHKLGLASAGAIDLAGACAGFIYALTLGAGFAAAQQAPVLIIAANILSRRINTNDRNTSILFADGAGAVVVAPTPRADAGIIGAHLTSDGSAYGMIQIPAGGSRRPHTELAELSEMLMAIEDGQAVFANAVAMMVRAATTALHRAGLTPADVQHFIPHQANARIMRAVADKLEIPLPRMRSTIATFANSSAATIPLTLSATLDQHAIKRGDVVLMTAAGAGLTGGAVVLRW